MADGVDGRPAAGGVPDSHDDDELASALQAQLERFAPTGSLPIVPAAAGPVASGPTAPGTAGGGAGAARPGGQERAPEPHALDSRGQGGFAPRGPGAPTGGAEGAGAGGGVPAWRAGRVPVDFEPTDVTLPRADVPPPVPTTLTPAYGIPAVPTRGRRSAVPESPGDWPVPPASRWTPDAPAGLPMRPPRPSGGAQRLPAPPATGPITPPLSSAAEAAEAAAAEDPGAAPLHGSPSFSSMPFATSSPRKAGPPTPPTPPTPASGSGRVGEWPRSSVGAGSASEADPSEDAPHFAPFHPPSLRMPPTAPIDLPPRPSSGPPARSAASPRGSSNPASADPISADRLPADLGPNGTVPHERLTPAYGAVPVALPRTGPTYVPPAAADLQEAESNWTAFLQESRPSRPAPLETAKARTTYPPHSDLPASFESDRTAGDPRTLPSTAPIGIPGPDAGRSPSAPDAKAIERLERLMPLLSSMQLDDSEYLAWESRLREAAGIDGGREGGSGSDSEDGAPDGAFGGDTDGGADGDSEGRGADRPANYFDPPSVASRRDAPLPAPTAVPLTPDSSSSAASTAFGLPMSPTAAPVDLPREDLSFPPPGTQTGPTGVRIGPPSDFAEPMLAYPRMSSTGPVPRLDEPLDDEYVYEPVDTTNTGSIPINTGSVPIVTVIDPDLDDDADDVWQPEEALLGPGNSAPVAPPAHGQDTGPITPILTPRLDEEAPLLLPNEVAKGRPAFSIEEPVTEPTPLEQRVGRTTRMFWLWFAPNASIVTLALGASVVALGVSLRQALVATLVGTLIACLPLGTTVLGAKRTGQPMAVASRATFGVVGNVVPAALQVGIRLAWAAVLLWLVGGSVSSLVVEAGWDIFVGPPIAAVVAAVAVAVLATAVATFGYWLLVRIQLVITGVAAISVALVVGFTAPLVDLSVALSRPDGSWPLIVGGAMAVLSVLATAWLASGGETARYQRTQTTGSATVAWAAFGGALPAIILVSWGALLAASSDAMSAGLAADPIAALADQMPIWFPIPLLFAVLASLVAGVAATVYSGGLTLPGAGVPIGRVPSALAFGAIAAALGIVALLVTGQATPLAFAVLPTIAVPVLAWAGIVCTDLVTRNRDIDGAALLRRGDRYPDYRLLNLIALAVISIVGIGFLSSDGFGFEGYLWRLLGTDPAGDLASSDLGVLGALLLGLIVPLFGGLRAERPGDAQASSRLGGGPSIAGPLGRPAGRSRGASSPRPSGRKGGRSGRGSRGAPGGRPGPAYRD